jgi:hypothetical protein
MSVSTIDRPVSAVSIDLTQEGLASPQHVPEPSGLALLAAAVGGLALVRWRSSAQSRRILSAARTVHVERIYRA